MEIDPHIAVLAILSTGVGYLMLLAGLHKSALEWKRRQRICPSCGRVIEARVCSTCSAN